MTVSSYLGEINLISAIMQPGTLIKHQTMTESWNWQDSQGLVLLEWFFISFIEFQRPYKYFCAFSELLTGIALGWNHFKAMFIKRFLNSKREKKAVFTQIILPALVTLLGLALAQSLPSQREDPSRVLSVGNYITSGKTGVAYFADFRNTPDPNLLKVWGCYFWRLLNLVCFYWFTKNLNFSQLFI